MALYTYRSIYFPVIGQRTHKHHQVNSKKKKRKDEQLKKKKKHQDMCTSNVSRKYFKKVSFISCLNFVLRRRNVCLSCMRTLCVM